MDFLENHREDGFFHKIMTNIDLRDAIDEFSNQIAIWQPHLNRSD